MHRKDILSNKLHEKCYNTIIICVSRRRQDFKLMWIIPIYVLDLLHTNFPVWYKQLFVLEHFYGVVWLLVEC